MTSSVLTLIRYRFLCTALELIPNYGTSRGKKIKNDDKCLSASDSTRMTMPETCGGFLHSCFCIIAARVERGADSTCTSKISSTHLTHIHTYPSTGGWCESDRRKLQERSEWANGRGSLHDITPDTFDSSFNVTTQPLTPTTDVTGKPGRVCRTRTRVSVGMCAFLYFGFNVHVPSSLEISNTLVLGKSNRLSCI